MRKLKSFNVCNEMLHMFYQSAFYKCIFLFWGSCIRARDTKKPNKRIMKAGTVLGTALEPLELTVNRKMLQKLLTILDNMQHINYTTYFKNSRAFSAGGSSNSVVTRTAIGNLFCPL